MKLEKSFSPKQTLLLVLYFVMQFILPAVYINLNYMFWLFSSGPGSVRCVWVDETRCGCMSIIEQFSIK